MAKGGAMQGGGVTNGGNQLQGTPPSWLGANQQPTQGGQVVPGRPTTVPGMVAGGQPGISNVGNMGMIGQPTSPTRTLPPATNGGNQMQGGQPTNGGNQLPGQPSTGLQQYNGGNQFNGYGGFPGMFGGYGSPYGGYGGYGSPFGGFGGYGGYGGFGGGGYGSPYGGYGGFGGQQTNGGNQMQQGMPNFRMNGGGFPFGLLNF